jgi:hypothetical protein
VTRTAALTLLACLPAHAALVKTWSIIPAGAQATIQNVFVLQPVTASAFGALSPDSFGAAVAAMGSFAPVCGLSFAYTADWQSADVVVSADASPQQFGDVAYYAGFHGGNVSMDRGGIHVADAVAFRAYDLPVTGQPSLQRIIQHEVGHAAGLGHSADPLSLMYPSYSDNSFGWSAGDVADLQAIYGPPVPEPSLLFLAACFLALIRR